jgi:hypothetical protein
MPLPKGFTLDQPAPKLPPGFALDETPGVSQPVAAAAPPSVGGFLENVVSSGGKMFNDVATAVTHPLDTVDALTDVAAGAVEKLIPGEQKHEQAANALGAHFVDRYGGMDQFLNTLYTDPVGVAGDLSTVLGGGAAAFKVTAKAAQLAKLGRAAEAATVVSEALAGAGAAVDPLVATGRAVSKVAPNIGLPAIASRNPKMREATEFIRERGGRVNAGTATGNRFVQGVQALADHSPGGSYIAQGAAAGEQADLTRIMGELADEAHPAPMTPNQAGAGVAETVAGDVKFHNDEATRRYTRYRELESDAANLKKVANGSKTEVLDGKKITTPVYEDVALPVDYEELAAEFRPVLERYEYATPDAELRAGRGYKALKNIVDHKKRFVPASTAELDLGALKEAARTGEIPELATISQGFAKNGVTKLDRAITKAVREARTFDDAPAPAAAAAAPQAAPGAAAGTPTNLWEMGPDELDGLLTSARKSDKDIAVEVFGDRAKQYEQAYRKASSAYDPKGADAAQRIVDEMESSLTEKQRNRLFGIDEPGTPNIETIQGYRDSLGRLDFTSARDLGDSLQWAVSRLADHDDVSRMTEPQRVAYAQMRYAAQRANELGFDANEWSTAALAKAAQRFKDPDDAAFVLKRFLTPEEWKARPVLRELPPTGTDGPIPQREPARPIQRTAQTKVTVPGRPDDAYAARYELRELDDLQPSHNPNFEPNTKYQLRNDRNYSEAASQRKVLEHEAKFNPAYHITDNPDALNGPPVIDSHGNVLGGNGRTITLKRVNMNRADAWKGYQEALNGNLEKFGIAPDAAAGMKKPVLVRVVDDAEFVKRKKSSAITDFNVEGTEKLSPTQRAIADSRRVSRDTLKDVIGRLDEAGPDATLAQIVQGDAGPQIIERLIADDVISSQEIGELVQKGRLTPAGSERVQKLIVARYFNDATHLDNVTAAVRGKLEKVAAPLMRVEGVPEWDLKPHVQQAMELLEAKRTSGAGTVDDYIGQLGLLADQDFTPVAQALAKQLESVNPTELVKKMRAYADEMQHSDNYEGPGMFGDIPEPATPRDAFVKAFGVEIPEGAMEAPKPRAAPKFANFDEADMPKPAAARPTKSTGAEALAELRSGRSATRAKYEAGTVLKKLREEPRQVFEQMFYAKDAGVEYLKKVKQHAPGEMPKIGRAVIEDLFETATKDGGFDKARGIAAKWEGIGPETKEILFPNPKHRADLDKFFLYAKKAAETPNPSGTAYVSSIYAGVGLLIANPAAGAAVTLGSAAVSKLLHSPKGVDLLTRGLTIPVKDKTRAAMHAAAILRAAGANAEPVNKK